MFDVFGDFNSYEEINESAAGLKAEGDLENIKVLAKENGIDESVAEMYIAGECEDLVDVFGATMGKLLVEKKEIKNKNMPVDPIVDYLLSESLEDEFAMRIRLTEKKLSECIKQVEEKCRKECQEKKVNYIPDMAVFEWAKEYYVK